MISNADNDKAVPVYNAVEDDETFPEISMLSGILNL